MKKVHTQGYVAVVDPSEQFLHLEDALQDQLAPNAVVGFDDPKAFLDAIRDPQMKKMHNWLIVIADSAALVENGVFQQARLVWSECRGLAFTANPSDPKWRGIVASEEDIIPKADPKAASMLLRKILEHMGDFEDLLSGQLGGTIGVMGPDQGSRPEGKDAQQSTGAEQSASASESASRPVRPDTVEEVKRDTQALPPRLEDLVRPRTYLYRLLTKGKLNFIDRFLLREISYTLFKRLSRSEPERLNDYETFLGSSACDKRKLSYAIVTEQLRHSRKKPG